MQITFFRFTRSVRMVCSLALATAVLTQLPVGALLNTPALGQASPVYTDTEGEESSDFLNIDGVPNKTVIVGADIAIATYGVYRLIFDRPNQSSKDTLGLSNAPSKTNTTLAASKPLVRGDVKKSLWENLSEDPAQRFTRFTTIVAQNEGAKGSLQDKDNSPYTCFAPTNTAVKNLAPREMANETEIRKYIVYGKYSTHDLEEMATGFPLATLSGETMIVTKNSDGTVNVNGIKVVHEDIQASNGISHPITL